MKRMMAAALAGWITLGNTAAAQDDLAQREAVAAEYLALVMETMDWRPLLDQSSGMILGVIQQRQPVLYAEKAGQLKAIVETATAQSLREAMLGLDTALARALTLEELTATRDFYASPVGQSAMRKMPTFMAGQMPRIMQESLGNSAAMMQALAAEGVQLQ